MKWRYERWSGGEMQRWGKERWRDESWERWSGGEGGGVVCLWWRDESFEFFYFFICLTF